MSPDGRTKRILVVEDAFDQALLVKSFLQSQTGYEVVHSQDGDQAVSLLESQEWDLLVCDLNLPGTDGYQVIARAKAQDPGLPVLATTGYTARTYHEQAYRAGAEDLLVKPLDRAEFLGRVAQLMGGGAAATTGGGGSILAVGGLVGDAEMGCGGTLLAARAQGKDVMIVPLCSDDLDNRGAGLRGAKAAAAVLGVDVLLEEAAMGDTRGRVSLVELAVRDLAPDEVYLPAMDEDHPARREAFRITKAATVGVPRVLGYQTATTGVGFQPTVFRDVAGQMLRKMEALAAYQAAGAGRMDLTARMAQAYARFWGRFQEFGEVEAFEVIRDETA